MKLLMCHCQHCKHGRKRGPHGAAVTGKKHGARSKVRRLLRVGEWERLPQAVAIGYTD